MEVPSQREVVLYVASQLQVHPPPFLRPLRPDYMEPLKLTTAAAIGCAKHVLLPQKYVVNHPPGTNQSSTPNKKALKHSKAKGCQRVVAYTTSHGCRSAIRTSSSPPTRLLRSHKKAV